MENSPVIFDRMPEFSRIGSFSFLFWAILIGIFLSAVVNMGPSFITLVQTSLHRGFRSAAWFVTGVILNDAMVIAICILASVQIVMNSSREAAFACIGAGLILLLFGIFTFRKKVQDQKARDEYIEQRANEAIKKQDKKPAWFVFLANQYLESFCVDFLVLCRGYGGGQYGWQQSEHYRVFRHHFGHHMVFGIAESLGCRQVEEVPRCRTHYDNEPHCWRSLDALRCLLHHL